MKLSASLIHIRPAVETDVGFILKTWLDSYRDSAFGKQFPIDTYEKIQKEAIINFIQTNTVLVACLPDDHDTLIGFICYGTLGALPVVHYTYSKFIYRRACVAQMLLAKANITAPFVCSQINRKFYELRSINFLPMLTIREYDDLLSSAEPDDNIIHNCNAWFIAHLPEFREHRAKLLTERNQKNYRRKHYGETAQ